MQDTLSTAIAQAVAHSIDYERLADLVVARLTTAVRAQYDPDELLEVAALRATLGRHGRPISHATFQRNFVDTGLIRYMPGPNRTKRYVRRGDWEHIIQEKNRKP